MKLLILHNLQILVTGLNCLPLSMIFHLRLYVKGGSLSLCCQRYLDNVVLLFFWCLSALLWPYQRCLKSWVLSKLFSSIFLPYFPENYVNFELLSWFPLTFCIVGQLTLPYIGLDPTLLTLDGGGSGCVGGGGVI